MNAVARRWGLLRFALLMVAHPHLIGGFQKCTDDSGADNTCSSIVGFVRTHVPPIHPNFVPYRGHSHANLDIFTPGLLSKASQPHYTVNTCLPNSPTDCDYSSFCSRNKTCMCHRDAATREEILANKEFFPWLKENPDVSKTPYNPCCWTDSEKNCLDATTGNTCGSDSDCLSFDDNNVLVSPACENGVCQVPEANELARIRRALKDEYVMILYPRKVYFYCFKKTDRKKYYKRGLKLDYFSTNSTDILFPDYVDKENLCVAGNGDDEIKIQWDNYGAPHFVREFRLYAHVVENYNKYKNYKDRFGSGRLENVNYDPDQTESTKNYVDIVMPESEGIAADFEENEFLLRVNDRTDNVPLYALSIRKSDIIEDHMNELYKRGKIDHAWDHEGMRCGNHKGDRRLCTGSYYLRNPSRKAEKHNWVYNDHDGPEKLFIGIEFSYLFARGFITVDAEGVEAMVNDVKMSMYAKASEPKTEL